MVRRTCHSCTIQGDQTFYREGDVGGQDDDVSMWNWLWMIAVAVTFILLL